MVWPENSGSARDRRKRCHFSLVSRPSSEIANPRCAKITLSHRPFRADIQQALPARRNRNERARVILKPPDRAPTGRLLGPVLGIYFSLMQKCLRTGFSIFQVPLKPGSTTKASPGVKVTGAPFSGVMVI